MGVRGRTVRAVLVGRVLLLSAGVLWAHAAWAFPSSNGDATGDATIAARCGEDTQPSTHYVALHLSDPEGLPSLVRDEMIREAAALWQMAGVEVAPAREAAAPWDVPTPVYVTISGRINEPTLPLHGRRRLASIVFVDGKPTAQVRVYLREAERLLDASRVDERPFSRLPRKMQHRLMGRALGRALAHELGHLLFASPMHAPSGLMRQTHRTDDLLARIPAAFRVVAPPHTGC